MEENYTFNFILNFVFFSSKMESLYWYSTDSFISIIEHRNLRCSDSKTLTQNIDKCLKSSRPSWRQNFLFEKFQLPQKSQLETFFFGKTFFMFWYEMRSAQWQYGSYRKTNVMKPGSNPDIWAIVTTKKCGPKDFAPFFVYWLLRSEK